ncbi:MAG: hypothetical protein AAF267_12125, partial [Deinococcota bacterium]
TEELKICSEKSEHQKAAILNQYDSVRDKYEQLLDALSILSSDSSIDDIKNIPEDRCRALLIEASPIIIEICEQGKEFIKQVLIPTGLMSAIGSNSILLCELHCDYPKNFPNLVSNETLRITRKADFLVGDVSILPNSIRFFSPEQMYADLSGAVEKTKTTFENIHTHNTNYYKVFKGGLKVAGGFLGKFAGAAACMTGAGCLGGAAAIVGGTVTIVDGLEEISEGLEED